jgi:hypothetical protein
MLAPCLCLLPVADAAGRPGCSCSVGSHSPLTSTTTTPTRQQQAGGPAPASRYVARPGGDSARSRGTNVPQRRHRVRGLGAAVGARNGIVVTAAPAGSGHRSIDCGCWLLAPRRSGGCVGWGRQGQGQLAAKPAACRRQRHAPGRSVRSVRSLADRSRTAAAGDLVLIDESAADCSLQGGRPARVHRT